MGIRRCACMSGHQDCRKAVLAQLTYPRHSLFGSGGMQPLLLRPEAWQHHSAPGNPSTCGHVDLHKPHHFTHLSAPVWASKREVAMASTSSMKMMAGAFSLASLNTSLTILGPCSRPAVHQTRYAMWLPSRDGQPCLVKVLWSTSKNASQQL